MVWSWSVTLQGSLLFMRHPEILLSLASFLFFYILRRVYQSGSELPVNWPVVGMLPAIIANNHRLLDYVTTVLRESDCTYMFKGPWFSGMNFLLTCDPADAKHIFNVHFSNYPKGDEFLETFDILGNGIFNADGDSWMVQRRMAHAHISDQRFQSSVAKCSREKAAQVLLPLLNQMAEFNKVVDFNDVFMRFTFDTVCTLVLGVDPGCLASDFPTVPFAKAVDDAEQVLFFRHTVPMIWWKLLRWLRVGKEKKMLEAWEVIDRFIALRIKELRREDLKVNEGSHVEEALADLLTPYIDCPMEDTAEGSFRYDDKFLRDTVLTFLAAGKDTTTAAIVWFFWLVSKNPDVEKKILEELRELRSSNPKEHSTSDDEMTVFDAEELDVLVYLHAALCETLRLFPSIPFNHKVALKPDVLPSGHQVQSGMKVIFSMYSMGRMERIWGKDCLEFKPERWISDEGKLKHVPSYKFLSFNSGPRSCLGKNMAFTQMKVVAAAVIYNFQVRVVEGHKAEPKLSIVLQIKNGLTVEVTKRRLSVGIDGT